MSLHALRGGEPCSYSLYTAEEPRAPAHSLSLISLACAHLMQQFIKTASLHGRLGQADTSS